MATQWGETEDEPPPPWSGRTGRASIQELLPSKPGRGVSLRQPAHQDAQSTAQGIPDARSRGASWKCQLYHLRINRKAAGFPCPIRAEPETSLHSVSAWALLPASPSSLAPGGELSQPPGVSPTRKLQGRKSSYCWKRYIFFNVSIITSSSLLF